MSKQVSKTDHLYPGIEPFSTGFLDVGDGHKIYFEECGNPNGIAVLYFHGGPGSGASVDDRRYFKPDVYRVIIFDQRGCGRSTPLGETHANTLRHLVEDTERLRRHLSISRWVVFGGSWGSTLALHYCALHPNQCISLVVRGVFLMRSCEIDWWAYGMRNFFPQEWGRFAQFVDYTDGRDLLDRYYRRIHALNSASAQRAAIEWNRYETACSRLIPVTAEPDPNDNHALARAKIQSHYFTCQVNDRIANDALRSLNVGEVPVHIIQARYDVICPMRTAYEVHLNWKNTSFTVIEASGHSPKHALIQKELVDVMDRLAENVK